MESPILTTNQKALEINLDESKYGTFAEIGAGQDAGSEDAVFRLCGDGGREKLLASDGWARLDGDAIPDGTWGRALTDHPASLSLG
jgi:hypothetical protein